MKREESGAAGVPLRSDLVFFALAAATLLLHVHLAGTQSVPYRRWWAYIDEGYRLYPSLRLLRGEMLFRDMFTEYPPFSYYLHLWAFQIFGVKISSVRLVLAASQTAATLLTYALARRLVGRGLALFAALLSVAYGIANLNMGYSGWYVVPLGAATLLLLFRHFERPAVGALVAAGAFAGLGIGTKLRDGGWLLIAAAVTLVVARVLRDYEPGRGRARPLHPLDLSHLLLPVGAALAIRGYGTADRFALFVAPALLVSFALLAKQLCFSGAVRGRPGALARELVALGAGAAAVNAPWLLYYGWRIGPAELWHQVVMLPLAMKDRLVIWWVFEGSVSGYAGILLLALGAALAAARRPALRRWMPHALALLLVALAAATRFGPLDPEALRFAALPFASALAVALVAARWRSPGVEAQRLAALGVFNACAALTLFPWTDFNHWLWACGPALLLFTAAGDHALRAAAPLGVPARGLAAAALALALLAAAPPALHPRRLAYPGVVLAGAPAADVPVSRNTARALQPVVDFIARRVPEDGYLLELPGSFYSFITGRRQAARLDYFWILDGEIWDEEREIESIRARDPRYAIVTIERENWWREGFPKLGAFVDERFRPIGRVGPVRVLERVDAAIRSPSH